MLMRADVLVGGVVLVAVGVMVMVEVVVVSFSEGRCLPVAEVECVVVDYVLVGGDALNFSGWFVAMMVETVVGDSKLEVVAVVRIVWSCVNGELYYLWRLSRKSLEGKMGVFSVGGCLFGVCWWVSLRCGDADRFFDGVVFGGYVVGEVTEVHVSNIVVGIDFDGFDFGIFCSNFCSCGRFLKE